VLLVKKSTQRQADRSPTHPIITGHPLLLPSASWRCKDYEQIASHGVGCPRHGQLFRAV
jgi:hypothetical protein